ncbi:MAG: holo-ACP synthase, partial [Lachnospiraceae bacterium]|nr:holo-ACP synthase [Lachnospiraceae bacterium]
MMISVGTDILEIERMERLQKKGRIDRIFTEEERRQSEGRTSRLAGDFSVKEAVAKTFGTGVRGFSLLEIEVLRDALGKPFVKLYGNARKVFDSLKGQSIEVSISNTGKLVIATAILVKKRNRDRAE